MNPATSTLERSFFDKSLVIFYEWAYKFIAAFLAIECIYISNGNFFHMEFTDILNEFASITAIAFSAAYAVMFLITDLVKDWSSKTVKPLHIYRDDFFNRLIEPLIFIGTILFSYLIFSEPEKIAGLTKSIWFYLILDTFIVFISLFFKHDFKNIKKTKS